MYRSDAAHSGATHSITPTQNITSAWKYAPSLPLNGQPVLFDNTIYAATSDGNIYAIEAHTGDEKWTEELSESGVDYSPAITNNRLLLSTVSNVIAYDLSGSFQWRIPLEGTPIAPTIHNDAGYVATTEIGSLVRFNPKDGETLWTRTTDPTEHVPSVDDSHIYTAELGGDVFARKVSDGTKSWHHILPEMPSTTAVLSNNRAYVGTYKGHLVAINTKTGERVWGQQVKSQTTLYAPVVSSDRVYTVDRHGTVYAFSHSGDLQWTYNTGGHTASNVVDLSPTRSKNTLFTLSPDNIIHVFDISSGDKQPNSVAKVGLENQTATPIIGDSVLFTCGSKIQALEGTSH